MKVIIDTGVLIALSVKTDPHHEKVVSKYNEYDEIGASILVSDYILDEYFTRLIYDFNSRTAKDRINKILESIDKREIALLRVDPFIFKEATAICIKYIEHQISFTDATTYALYKILKLDEIFTLDRDFKKMRVRTSF